MSEQKQASKPAFPIATAVCVALAFCLWSAYCYLAARWPQSIDQPGLRASFHILCMLVSALLFRLWIGVELKKREYSSEDYFGFRNNWIVGAIVGIIVAAIYISVMLFDPLQGARGPFPNSFASWLNIIGIPIAAEMLFRSLLTTQIFNISQSLDGARGWDSWISAVILSAVVSAAFNLPEWLITDPVTPQLIVKLATFFGFGCAYAVLFLATRSIWASLIPHCAYNLIATWISPS